MLVITKQNILPCAVVISVILLTVSCATGPSSAPPGTPPFYWQAAQETFAVGDYVKANSHLEELVKEDNEYTARARPWRLILTAGMARGYAELANNFEAGGRANRANPTPFRTQTAEYRTMAGRHALQFAETFLRFKTHDHTQPIPLDFGYPTGNPAQVVELSKVANGVLLPEAQLAQVQKRVIERAVLLSLFEAVGAKEDAAKTQAIFKAGNVQIEHDTFAMAMANNFHVLSSIFSREKLDRPDRMELFCNEGLEALKTVEETKECKKLVADLEKLLKSVKR